MICNASAINGTLMPPIYHTAEVLLGAVSERTNSRVYNLPIVPRGIRVIPRQCSVWSQAASRHVCRGEALVGARVVRRGRLAGCAGDNGPNENGITYTM